MARVQTTLGELDHKDLKILASFRSTTVSALVRELIKEGLDNVRVKNREYFQNARSLYEMTERNQKKEVE